jgi:HNH endonuclease
MGLSDNEGRTRILAKVRDHRNQLRSKFWQEFRNNMISIAGNCCEECGREESKTVILQVHHKHYTEGKKLWEYDVTDCAVLCRGCHATEHGIVRPFSGWEYCDAVALDSYGDQSCEICDTPLLYVHTISHEKWGELEVGCDYAEMMTCDGQPSLKKKELRNLVERRKGFLSEKKWQALSSKNGVYRLYSGRNVLIYEKRPGYRLEIEGLWGPDKYEDIKTAKLKAFSTLDNDDMCALIDRKAAKKRRHNLLQNPHA